MSKILPSTFRKYVVQKISPNFRDAVKLVTATFSKPENNEIVVKNRYVGINASDINYTAARYDANVKPPFDCGFEGVGEVVATGPGCSKISVGQAVGYSKFGAFSEYTTLKEDLALPLPSVQPEFISYMVSGLTAAIALDKVGEVKPGEKVLVTAAAGGTGQFAVQWAKNIGCHVVGTCSSDEKVEFLKSIGCDRPINYSKENLKTVLKEEYPKGFDVIYECVGADVFDTCVNSLATKGRLILIGFVAGYESAAGFVPLKTATPALVSKLITKSASIRGFFVFHFARNAVEYLGKIAQLHQEGKLVCAVDNGKNSPTGPFKGLDSIPNAVEYLYSKKNVGKIFVDLQEGQSKL